MSSFLPRLSFAAVALVAAQSFAAPPADHPSPAQARAMLLPEKAPRPSELPNAGQVVNVLHANEFSYIEVHREQTRASEWIATQKTEIKPGSKIRYEDGAVMKDFYSKLLQQTFPSVMFVDYVAVTATP